MQFIDQQKLARYGSLPVTHDMLMTDYPNLSYPKDKVAQLARSGSIIRLKKGLYVTSSDISGIEYCKELIANHLYGPSYVSLETALAYHGMIPERVFGILSATPKASRSFHNQIGRFDYVKVPDDYYPNGIVIARPSEQQSFLIASPTKAVCDLLLLLRSRIQSKAALRRFLYDDMRISPDAIRALDVDTIDSLARLGHKAHLLGILKEVILNG
ncbi:MAG: hypothetical protein FWH50_02510 [Coriobacteriia bacterium]|nr:hypothetical protein [Coriobacteriia bacterium]